MSETHDYSANNAVALFWEGKDAPRVTAKGEDALAQQIIALAKKHDIPMHEDAQLARLLVQLELGEEIPSEVYVAIAKVIAFAYFVAGRTSILGEQET